MLLPTIRAISFLMAKRLLIYAKISLFSSLLLASASCCRRTSSLLFTMAIL